MKKLADKKAGFFKLFVQRGKNMIPDLERLTEREKQMKALYQGEGREFLSRPMSYAEYKKLIEEHPEYPDVGRL